MIINLNSIQFCIHIWATKKHCTHLGKTAITWNSSANSRYSKQY